MTREEACSRIEEAINAFVLEGSMESYAPYGKGHINDTFLLTMKKNNESKPYILQRINHEIFTKPIELIENVAAVTQFLREKITKLGGNPDRETLRLLEAKDGRYYYRDSIGSYWRIYQFISEATSYNSVQSDEDFYQSAIAFGRFQGLLADFPVASLHETIENFHHTQIRFKALQAAVEADPLGRVKEVQAELEFAFSRQYIADVLVTQLHNKELPLRVIHNDTKMNNVMIDNATGKAICVIDLDTVMPGLSAYDFGDSIRYGASTAEEDETDLSKVSCSMHLFEVYTRGYLEGCNQTLTGAEAKALPIGAITMTYECAIRFLTDYILGDKYFKIHREKHNLDRCRTQLRLVEDMEKKLPMMQEIVNRCYED